MKIKTVAIDRGGKRVIINRSKFDPRRHKRWGDTDQAQPENEPAPELEQSPEPKDDTDEKDELIAALAEKGIQKDRRSSVESLRKALEE